MESIKEYIRKRIMMEIYKPLRVETKKHCDESITALYYLKRNPLNIVWQEVNNKLCIHVKPEISRISINLSE